MDGWMELTVVLDSRNASSNLVFHLKFVSHCVSQSLSSGKGMRETERKDPCKTYCLPEQLTQRGTHRIDNLRHGLWLSSSGLGEACSQQFFFLHPLLFDWVYPRPMSLQSRGLLSRRLPSTCWYRHLAN